MSSCLAQAREKRRVELPRRRLAAHDPGERLRVGRVEQRHVGEIAGRHLFNLTDGEPVSKKRFVRQVAALAGLKPPTRHIPLGLAKLLATVVESIAKLRGAKNPPLINKARYKFLGLNLDYSIEKARRILDYQPPYSTEDGLIASLADLVPPATKPEPVSAH